MTQHWSCGRARTAGRRRPGERGRPGGARRSSSTARRPPPRSPSGWPDAAPRSAATSTHLVAEGLVEAARAARSTAAAAAAARPGSSRSPTPAATPSPGLRRPGRRARCASSRETGGDGRRDARSPAGGWPTSSDRYRADVVEAADPASAPRPSPQALTARRLRRHRSRRGAAPATSSASTTARSPTSPPSSRSCARPRPRSFARLLGTHVQRLATIAHGDGVCTTYVPAPPRSAPHR